MEENSIFSIAPDSRGILQAYPCVNESKSIIGYTDSTRCDKLSVSDYTSQITSIVNEDRNYPVNDCVTQITSGDKIFSTNDYFYQSKSIETPKLELKWETSYSYNIVKLDSVDDNVWSCINNYISTTTEQVRV